MTAVRGDDGEPRLFYRRTFNVVGFVASAVSILVLLAGAVVSLFLALDTRPFLAATSMGITFGFTVGILLLVPRRTLAVLSDPDPGTLALWIRELSLPGLPNPTFEVQTPDGSTIGYLRKHTMTSFPARKWMLLGPKEERIGIAKEAEPASAGQRLEPVSVEQQPGPASVESVPEPESPGVGCHMRPGT